MFWALWILVGLMALAVFFLWNLGNIFAMHGENILGIDVNLAQKVNAIHEQLDNIVSSMGILSSHLDDLKDHSSNIETDISNINSIIGQLHDKDFGGIPSELQHISMRLSDLVAKV
jgi:hypothetical protein